MDKIIDYLNKQKVWEQLDETHAVAEITLPLPSWQRARRMISSCSNQTKPKGNSVSIERPMMIEVRHWYNKPY